MFAHRFFTAKFYAARYFPPVVSGAPVVVTIIENNMGVKSFGNGNLGNRSLG